MYRCSIIVVDTNPFAGDHLRLLLMQSEYYVIMAGPDRGSTNAIQKLCEMVPEWYKKTVVNTCHKVANAYPELGRRYPFPQNAPKFLGIILGNWASRTNAVDPITGMTRFSQGLSTDMPHNKFKVSVCEWPEALVWHKVALCSTRASLQRHAQVCMHAMLSKQ